MRSSCYKSAFNLFGALHHCHMQRSVRFIPPAVISLLNTNSSPLLTPSAYHTSKALVFSQQHEQSRPVLPPILQCGGLHHYKLVYIQFIVYYRLWYIVVNSMQNRKLSPKEVTESATNTLANLLLSATPSRNRIPYLRRIQEYTHKSCSQLALILKNLV